jgi:xylan 1,4-beta-xylosidase
MNSIETQFSVSRRTPKSNLISIILVAAALSVVSCARTKDREKPPTQVHTFRYTNPITRDPSQSMRDHIIVKEGNRWYMTGTSQPIWDGPNPGVRLMVSDDLLHWRDTAWLIDANKLPDDCPYKGRFYAPEIRKINGKFYLVVNSGHFPKKGEYWEANHKAWIFSSDDIAGPYSLITPNGLAVGDYANDASLFGDDDGKTYLYCCTYTGDNKGLHQAEIDLKTGKLVDETKGVNGFEKIVGPREKGYPDWMAGGIEGPYVIKRHGFYWMFFSAWTRGYEIGVLKASSPLGPWELASREPILGTRKHEVRDPLAKSEGYDFVKYEDTKDPYVEVGHNGIFEGPDGKDWICCHYWLRGEKVIANPHVPIYNNTSEQLGIEPLLFENGVFKVNGPTWTEQVVTWEK